MSEWVRKKPPTMLVRMFGNARAWQKDLDDGHLTVLRTVEQIDGKWRTHVSISHRTDDLEPGRYPTWDEQKEAVWRFAPGKKMASYLPPEGAPYVNIHSTTFHWWEVDDEL